MVVPGREAEDSISQRSSSDQRPIAAVVQEQDSARRLAGQSLQPIGGLRQVDGGVKPRLLQVVRVCEDEDGVTTPLWTEETLETDTHVKHSYSTTYCTRRACHSVTRTVPPRISPDVSCRATGQLSQRARARARPRGRARAHSVGGAAAPVCQSPSA